MEDKISQQRVPVQPQATHEYQPWAPGRVPRPARWQSFQSLHPRRFGSEELSTAQRAKSLFGAARLFLAVIHPNRLPPFSSKQQVKVSDALAIRVNLAYLLLYPTTLPIGFSLGFRCRLG